MAEADVNGEVLLVTASRIFGRALSRALSACGFAVRLEREIPGANEFVAPDEVVLCVLQGDPSRILRSVPDTVPVIAFSTDAAEGPAALTAGARDFFRVPCRDEDVRAKVEHWLAESALEPDAPPVCGPLSTPPDDAAPSVVLVVEDSHVQRMVAVKVLQQRGFEVHEAEDGQQGFERALELVPDLVVTDSEMPVMDGREMTRKIRQHHLLRDVPVLMLTAADSEIARDEGRAAGVSAYVYKPFAADEVQATAEKLIAGVIE